MTEKKYPLFIKGLQLNQGFYSEVVKPLLDDNFSGLQYSASLLGYGSDAAGYDTETSMDHNWGPRLQIFVNDEKLIPDINNCLRNGLPFEYKGFPVNYSEPAYDKVQRMVYTDKKPVNHLIEIKTAQKYFKDRYSLSALKNFKNNDWLAFTDQNLLEITSGLVFHDGLNVLNPLRTELKFYPQDILKLRLAVLWNYIWNKEAFIGRSIALNDFIGLKIQAGRIVNYLIKILFYLEGKYIPYSKWFGTAFKDLKIYRNIEKFVTGVLTENEPLKIETSLCALYEETVKENNAHPQLPFIKNKIRDYFNRPYRVIFAEDIVSGLVDSIQNEKIKKTNLQKYAHDIILDY
ncbi:MAG: DUF4037 domain-containing protein [Treponema sp.]|nr:DUF4037 domain-containing protein [Treponema sp.]